MSDEDLPESRLATTDEFGERVYIHPHDVKGKWRNLRKVVYWFLIGVYLFTPWVYVGGKQIIRLNLPAREFYIFGTTFYGHDGPFLVFLVLSFVFFISFVTTVLGRVWCGYACPQTVFIDAIYRVIERVIEGSGAKRDKLEKSPWNLEKIFKRTLKWFLYTLVSLHIVHSGMGYFVGTRELLYITTESPFSNLYLFVVMLSLTLIVLIDFAWFREQFCIIACPYGRFQSIVMDENSLAVTYNEKRGEPRKRSHAAKTEPEGDCVACNRCVNVCPTGIDIREGLQMECIACTMCIDACDDIMKRVGKPTGLISYSTQRIQSGKSYRISGRAFIYFALLLVTLFALSKSLQVRAELKAQFLRSGNTIYQELKVENRIINHFKVKLNYMSSRALDLKIIVTDSGVEMIIPEEEIKLLNENKTLDIFFKFPPNLLEGGVKKIEVKFQNHKQEEILVKEIQLFGPARKTL